MTSNNTAKTYFKYRQFFTDKDINIDDDLSSMFKSKLPTDLQEDIHGGTISSKTIRCSSTRSNGVKEYPMDVWESEKQLTIDLEAPGLTKKDINIEIVNNTLVIKGKVLPVNENNSIYGKRILNERSYGEFSKSFKLPNINISEESVQAKYHDGILSITIPKNTKKRVTKISLS